MYESPITAIFKESLEKIIQQQENAICAAIEEKLDIRVDPQELKKALAYDSDQYKKGWEDAKRTYKAPDAVWEYKTITDDYRVYGRCSNCLHRKRVDNFCSNCGAKILRKESDDD